MTDYTLLSQFIKEKGLLQKQPLYYAAQGLFLLSICVLTLLLLLSLSHTGWNILILAILTAFTYVQIGLISHDVVHYQVFNSTKISGLVALFTGNMLFSMSMSWWQDQHNAHHANPNDVSKDPHIDLPLTVFSSKQLNKKGSIQKNFIRYQAYLYFPIATLVAFYQTSYSFFFLITRKPSGYILELALLIVHIIIYCLFVFTVFSFLEGVFFIIIHRMVSGLYMSLVFAPNHKGMPMINDSDKVDNLRRQTIPTRNIRGNLLTDLIYGGLNYQIEHHLFPSMPRNNLKHAKPIVEKFCQERQIPYHETGIWQSFKEIMTCLQKESGRTVSNQS